MDGYMAAAYLRRVSKEALEYEGWFGSRFADLPQPKARTRMSRRYLAAAVYLEQKIASEERAADGIKPT